MGFRQVPDCFQSQEELVKLAKSWLRIYTHRKLNSPGKKQAKSEKDGFQRFDMLQKYIKHGVDGKNIW